MCADRGQDARFPQTERTSRRITMSNRETLEALRRLGPEKVLNGVELCPCCDSLSLGIAMDGETIVHCPVCGDRGHVTVEAADAWREKMRKRYAGE
jgi:hypothetical protein